MPDTETGKRLLDELAENPLPGARYAHAVVSRRLAAIEAEAVAAEWARIRAAVEGMHVNEAFGGVDIPAVLAIIDQEDTDEQMGYVPASGDDSEEWR